MQPGSVHVAYFNSERDISEHELFHGDALAVLRTRPDRSVHCAITSPPYWPARRLYGDNDSDQIGLEPTLAAYLNHLMAVFAEVQRVLRDDGVCWVLIDDAISQKSYRFQVQTYWTTGDVAKRVTQSDFRTQDTTYLAPLGEWLDIPGRFIRAMRSIGWRHRDTIIWDKGALGRKKSTSTRCRHNFEYLLMFTKRASPHYWYDADTLRIPLVGDRPYSVSKRTAGWAQGSVRKDGISKRSSAPANSKDGVLRRDKDRDYRIFSNPLGRLCDAVWTIPPVGWAGTHSSAMPVELARRCLLLTCPPGGTVIDQFGGTATVCVAAKQLGMRSVYIERHAPFVEEARARLAGTLVEDGAANDNQSPSDRSSAD